jgi:superfamily II DNA or RNA helicase
MEPTDRCVHGMIRMHCAFCGKTGRKAGMATHRASEPSAPPRPSSRRPPSPPESHTRTPNSSASGTNRVATDLASHRVDPAIPPRFRVNNDVQLKTDPTRVGVIRTVTKSDSGYSYEVYFSATDRLHYPEDKLEPARQSSNGLLSHRDFLRELLLRKLRSPLSDSLYSFRASRTQFLVYQFKPVLKLLNSPEQRILIADEVGLGKTIEAGIIYLELKARVNLQRVLVVCPSGLKSKWRDELRLRFDEEFTVLDAKTVREFLQNYERFGGRERLKGICSLESLRREELASELARLRVHFDLVVIDEAHHLRNAGTLSNAMGEILADQSDALVLLTATPLQTGTDNLFHLMQLVSPGEFDSLANFEDRIRPNQHINAAARLVGRKEFSRALAELRSVEQTAMSRSFRSNPYYDETVAMLDRGSPLNRGEIIAVQRRLQDMNTLSRVFNRTRKREVTDAAIRDAHKVEVEFSPAERAFYDRMVEFVRWQLGQYQHAQNVPIFAVIMRERQAASCIQALRSIMEKSLTSSKLVLCPEESSSELAEDGITDRVGQAERPKIEDLLSLCRNLENIDTKFDRFLSALRTLLLEDQDCKVLVFSFFRDTLEYLRTRLSKAGYKVGVIHGGVAVEERQKRIAQFRDDPATHIMLASEVGAEGLDFQFCGALFNYDLPWNPMKVEQRIGRLDRYGQIRPKIHIYNMVISDTIETRIFLKLYERIHLFESSIGDLEAILGEEVRQISRDVFMNRLTKQEEMEKAEQAAHRLERYRQDQEEFETQRKSLMGQDDFFERELGQMLESGRFVSSDEVRSLVESYVEDVLQHTHLTCRDDDGLYALVPGQDLIQQLWIFRNRSPRHHEQTERFAGRLRADEAIYITFDPETARDRKSVEFVTVHHPLALAAIDHFKQRQNQVTPTTAIWAASPDGRSGDFGFFIFGLHISGVTPTSTLMPVLIDLQTGIVVPETPAGFMAEVQTRRPNVPPQIACDAGQVSVLQETAQLYMVGIAREKEKEIQQRNDAIIEARIGSLEQSFGFRIRRTETQMVDAWEPRIRRMRQSQIENLKGQLQAKREEIEKRRQVSIGYGLVASGMVRFDPALPPIRISLAGTTSSSDTRETETARQTAVPSQRDGQQPLQPSLPPLLCPTSAPRLPDATTDGPVTEPRHKPKAPTQVPVPPVQPLPAAGNAVPGRSTQIERTRDAPPSTKSTIPATERRQERPKRSLLGRILDWLK